MWQDFYYSFPIQLLIIHLRKNLALIGIWILLISIVLGNFGKVLGIPYLFLDPEYLNEVNWVSFFLMGIGMAIFTMAFLMTTYIMDGPRYKFLAILNSPFLHYCLNNFIVPFLFYLIYIISFIGFQLDNDHENNWIIFRFFLGFMAGSVITYLFLFSYFRFTNKDFFVLFADTVDRKLRKTKLPRANIYRRYKERKSQLDFVSYFLTIRLKPEPVPSNISSFERNKLLKVFDQNHLNLLLIQSVLIVFILFLGFFREYEYFQLPAAMSALLLLSILTMMVGAVSFWLRNWAAPTAVLFAILVNSISQTSLLNRPHTAFGMDYDHEPATYNLGVLQSILHPDTVEKDKENTIKILNNWKNQFSEGQPPKLVLIATSGGGQRAALWTLNVLQHAYQNTNGKFFRHTRLITGASGGVMGAAFFRELYLRSLDDNSIDLLDEKYLQQIASDNLNPIIFTLLVNDILIRSQYFNYNGRRYLKDRGYAFESQLNKNTEGILDKPLKDYKKPELEGIIPMLPITPLVINDGRKLFISPHSMSYMGVSRKRLDGQNEKKQAIDFVRFYREQDGDNLRFISALRMGASFPFITPNIQLPSDPVMETMDTGLSDNFGIQDAIRFLFVFQEWIRDNTSGVVILTIRDSEKSIEIEKKVPPSILQKLVIPLKNIYANWNKVQTLDNEVLFAYMQETLPFQLERIEFEYATRDFLEERSNLLDIDEEVQREDLELERASLNWRLTKREKRSIIDNIKSSFNQSSLNRLKDIFEKESD